MNIKSEKPHIISRELSEVLGMQPATVICQVDYWVRKNEGKKRNFFDGRYWTYNTYEEWRRTNFSFWKTERSVRNWIGVLVKEGFLLRKRGKYKAWLTVNYERIGQIDPQSQKKLKLTKIPRTENFSVLSGKPFRSPASPESNYTDIPFTKDCPSDTTPPLSNVSKTENLASENGKHFRSQIPDSFPGWWYDRVMEYAEQVLGEAYAGYYYLDTREDDIATERKGIKTLFDAGYTIQEIKDCLDKLAPGCRFFMFRQEGDIEKLMNLSARTDKTEGGDKQ